MPCVPVVGRFLALALMFNATAALAQEEVDIVHALTTAKIAGACSAMNEMAEFQKKRRIRGGNEFVAKFWESETKRLGVTMEEFRQTCITSIDTYIELAKANGLKEK